MTPEEFAKFISRIDTSGGHDSCWPWTAGRDKRKGYGLSKHGRVNRAMFELVVGPIPDGMFVCHVCDNTSCANPTHLFLGTSADNSRDMIIKSRSAKGQNHSQAKLCDEEVISIRKLANGGLSTREIATRFNMSMVNIRDIVNKKTWKHLGDTPSGPKNRRKRNNNLQRRSIGEENIEILCSCGCGLSFKKYDVHGRGRCFIPGHNTEEGTFNFNSKLSAGDVIEIRKTGASIPYAETARKYRVSPATISSIVRRKTWKNA